MFCRHQPSHVYLETMLSPNLKLASLENPPIVSIRRTDVIPTRLPKKALAVWLLSSPLCYLITNSLYVLAQEVLDQNMSRTGVALFHKQIALKFELFGHRNYVGWRFDRKKPAVHSHDASNPLSLRNLG